MSNITSRKPNRVYLERLIFMAALLIPSSFMQGVRVLPVAALSVAFCMITDRICCLIRKIPYDRNDATVPFWGLAAAMLMPSCVPLWLTALSAVICIALGKHIFGGSDNILFSPPALAAAFLIICYPSNMLYFTRVGEQYPVFGEFSGTLVRSLEHSLELRNVPTYLIPDVMMGNVPGSIGAVNIFVILVCAVCLLFRRGNSICAVVSCLVTAGAIAFFFPRADIGGMESVVYELSSGYLLFGTVFLSAEPYLVPKKRAARVMYGVVLGYTTMMFRHFGQTECCFVFALLLTGALSGCFDRIVDNLVYWKKHYISSFEKNKTIAQHGGVKLTDTQEIVLPEKYRYNTPPIDGEIKKKHRKDAEEDSDEND